jgi:ParB family chromosome partitioning protein
VAEAVGKSRSHVANTLRLLQLPTVIQTLVRSGKLSAGHARTIIGAADPVAIARKVMAQGLNVRETENLVRLETEGRKAPATPAVRNADTLALERDLSDRLGLHVVVADRNGTGEVRVRYQSLEQLDDLCRRLLRG